MPQNLSSKPQIWLLEEATPEVALLMHQIERTGVGQADVRRVTYMETLRDLPRESARGGLHAIVVFSLAHLQIVAKLMKGLPAPRPRLLFWAPTFQALAALRPAQRWPVPVSAVARHAGEAAALAASGFRPELIVRLQGEVAPGALAEPDPAATRALRIGFAWYNLAPAQREALAAQVARWVQSTPDRCEWHLFCLPGDEPPPGWAGGHDVRVSCLTTTAPACDEPQPLDVWLSDPWWPEVLPRPWRSPITLALPPGGQPASDGWSSRLQALMDLGEPGTWHDDLLWTWAHQPVWRHLLGPDADGPGSDPGLATPNLTPLAAERARWHGWLTAQRASWPDRQDEGVPAAELAYFFWLYDYRVEVSWCLDLWASLDGAKNGERHALLMALNALRLHHTSASWLFKRLLAATPIGRAPERRRRFGRRFWLEFALRHPGPIGRWVRTLLKTGKDPEADPLVASQAVAGALLGAAGVRVVRRNEPQPQPGVPTLYLLSHRHGDLDPFLLLDVLPGQIAVVVGPRAQRWPLIGRLANTPAFVLTGRERGVVIADAIAAVRARRALALYPEVTEPSYLGEGTPLRSGLVWIVQALERSQVIPVVLDDAFALGPDGGQVDLWFGPPIPCTPESCDGLLHRVRQFFHQHVVRMNDLDRPGATPAALEATVPAAEPEPVATPTP